MQIAQACLHLKLDGGGELLNTEHLKMILAVSLLGLQGVFPLSLDPADIMLISFFWNLEWYAMSYQPGECVELSHLLCDKVRGEEENAR